MSDPTDKPLIIDLSTEDQGIGEPGQTRKEPLLDVQTFKDTFLFGIPLVAPLTGQELSDDSLKIFIRRGIGEFESAVRIPVTPVQCFEKFDYERADDIAFGTRRLRRWPILSVTKLEAQFPGRTLTQAVAYPTTWVECDGDTGLIRITPKSGTDVNTNANFVTSIGYQGLSMGGMKSYPALWQITYVAGFDFNNVPAEVNDLIGTFAAIKVLGMLGPSIMPYNSYSVGIDGMSQGTSNAGPQWLQARVAELQAQAEKLTVDLKSRYATDIQLWAF